MKASRVTALAVAALTLAGVTAASASSPGGDGDHGAARAACTGKFSHPRPNPYFPLVPGTVSVYRGSEDGQRYVERLVVTHRTKRIQGVETTVVRDVLRRTDGSLAEKTHDWYAADNRGNVCYLGEATATYDAHGELVSTEGSWEAGVDGAVAGLIMPADPRPTDAYRQEYYRGHAEDQAWIVQRHASTALPLGKLHDLVRSFEWTRLEKGVLSLKLYARGLGIVRERDMSGGTESFRLVSVTRR